MPRARYNHKLIRVPVPYQIAYDITYHYDYNKDGELIKKHWDRMGTVGKSLITTLSKGRRLTPKQRLLLLQFEYPEDSRLKMLKATIGAVDKKFAASFRANPETAYLEEEAAIQKAIRDRDCELKILSLVE